MEKRPGFIRLFLIISWMVLIIPVTDGSIRVTDTLQVHYTALQCDSLINANATNPDFAVMDVRTAAEYLPEHLEGAINRDYYDPGFVDLLDQLPRHKMYVIHCLSCGRSGNTFNIMVSMGFPCVVNMLGGITAWKNEGLPTTPDLAPLQMAVSDTVVPDSAVFIGTTDTLLLTVTNRANDILRFFSVTSLAGTEFSTDFDTATTLEGPFDYTFSLFYTPQDTVGDSVTFRIESNGGPVQFHVSMRGIVIPAGGGGLAADDPRSLAYCYPNPFSSRTTILFQLEEQGMAEIEIMNPLGQVVDRILHASRSGTNRLLWNAGALPSGIYLCRVSSATMAATCRLVLVR